MRLNVAASVVALVVGSGIMASGATAVTTSADLDFVVGVGANLSVLLIDFNAGPESSFAYGYRYDGSATGQDLLVAISMADPNLTLDSTTFVNSISYFDGTTNFSATGDFSGVSDTFFGYYIAGGEADVFNSDFSAVIGSNPIPNGGLNLPTSSEFTFSPVGTANRTLADGSFDALSFGAFDPQTFAHLAPPGTNSTVVAAAAVPEPSVIGLLASLLLVSGLRRKR